MARPSEELYRNGSTVIGTWRCQPSDVEFPLGWIDRPTIVFPRTSVQITQEGRDPVIADSNVVMLYRGDQEYTRTAVDPSGDRCEWFEVDPAWLRDATRPYDPETAESDSSPIAHTHAESPSQTYLLQRMLTRRLSTQELHDPVLVDEVLARLVEEVVSAAYHTEESTTSTGRQINRSHREAVEDAKAFIGIHFEDSLTLADIGRAVGVSPFHLARFFRRITGWTIHRYLTDMRLRRALEMLDGGTDSITEAAVSVGFCDNSHMTRVFRRRFGMTPSTYRGTREGDLRKNLLADDGTTSAI